MGKDKRGTLRLHCTACSCQEYEHPGGDGHDCAACGCKPSKHVRASQPKEKIHANKSLENARASRPVENTRAPQPMKNVFAPAQPIEHVQVTERMNYEYVSEVTKHDPASVIMGMDKRGTLRSHCTLCDCQEYEQPGDDRHDCAACGCKPSKHVRASQSKEFVRTSKLHDDTVIMHEDKPVPQPKENVRPSKPDDETVIMGLDKQGTLWSHCTLCDCKVFKQPGGDGTDCAACGCKPSKHVQASQPKENVHTYKHDDQTVIMGLDKHGTLRLYCTFCDCKVYKQPSSDGNECAGCGCIPIKHVQASQPKENVRTYKPDDQTVIMGLDKQGILRLYCTLCDCKVYKQPGIDGNECAGCGCRPSKHVQASQPKENVRTSKLNDDTVIMRKDKPVPQPKENVRTSKLNDDTVIMHKDKPVPQPKENVCTSKLNDDTVIMREDKPVPQPKENVRTSKPDDQTVIMHEDKQGILRSHCTMCDFKVYKQPGSDGNECADCGCRPSKHVQASQPKENIHAYNAQASIPIENALEPHNTGIVFTPAHLYVAKKKKRVIKQDDLSYEPAKKVKAFEPTKQNLELKLAVSTGDQADVFEALKLGGDASMILPEYSGYFSVSLLHVAAMEGHAYLIDPVQRAGADTKHFTESGLNATHIAARFGHMEVIKELFNRGMNRNFKSSSGLNVMHYANIHGHARIVTELATMQHGWSVEDKTAKGLNNLHLAAEYGQTHMLRVLVDLGMTVRDATERGFNALHFAAQNGQPQVIEELINLGININSATRSGHRADHLAASNGHPQVLSKLKSLGMNVRIPASSGIQWNQNGK